MFLHREMLWHRVTSHRPLFDKRKPKQNGRHFAEDIFKVNIIFLYEIFVFRKSLNLFISTPIDYKPSLGASPLVQITASHYLNHWWVVCWHIYGSLDHNVLKWSLIYVAWFTHSCQVTPGIPGSPIESQWHYTDVIMGTRASQITSLTIVYSTVYSDADQRWHQSSASLAFVRGIQRRPVNSPHKWPVTRKMFPFDNVIMETPGIIQRNLTTMDSE